MKNYELRSLTSDDIFPMFQIISKIGIREFKSCFESPDVKAAIAKSEGTDLNSVGLAVMLDIGWIVLANVPKAKDDIYLLLSQLSGLTKQEIGALPMATFAQMVIDVIRKDEFKDFFQVVSRLFKQGT
jgi:hypothetical protein